MKTAVLYARFSCSKQREASIDDQLRVCGEYCDREGIKVVKTYCDYAISGKTDHRPQFQTMIAEAPLSDYIVVYMMERFSRGKYDPAIYKKQLEDKGVRVLSALEYIPDAPEGIMIEKILEGQAAYFSLDVARKTRRGMEGNARKAMYNGYQIYGYDVDPDTKHYVVNEGEAAVVREVFRRYIGGETINRIAWTMAARGMKTSTGSPAYYGFIHRMLNNERYTGVYRWRDIEVPGGMPQIVDSATFRTAKGAGRKKVRVNEEFIEYHLTGKLSCAICGNPMHGTSGKGSGGVRYNYYACKKGGSCHRKPLRKELVEESVSAAVVGLVTDETEMRKIAGIMHERAKKSDTTAIARAARQSLDDNLKAQKNILKAVEQGIVPKGTKERLDELESQEGRLRVEVAGLEAQSADFDDERFFEYMKAKVNPDNCSLVIRAFVNQVFVFDGYAVATLNYRGESNELAEVRIALDEFALDPDGARGESRTRTS